MITICGKKVRFQECLLGFWPIITDDNESKRIPLLLTERQTKEVIRTLKQVPDADHPFNLVVMIVAGAISITMKYS